jgi:hypothetical protein
MAGLGLAEVLVLYQQLVELNELVMLVGSEWYGHKPG